jgi:hypothetical protein
MRVFIELYITNGTRVAPFSVKRVRNQNFSDFISSLSLTLLQVKGCHTSN